MGDLICAEIALAELGLNARDFLWLIEKRSQPWAEYRGLAFLCYDQAPWKMLKQTWRQHSLVINTEQLFGLAQACALAARAQDGRLACFDTVRGGHRANIEVGLIGKRPTRRSSLAVFLPQPWAGRFRSNEGPDHDCAR